MNPACGRDLLDRQVGREHVAKDTVATLGLGKSVYVPEARLTVKVNVQIPGLVCVPYLKRVLAPLICT